MSDHAATAVPATRRAAKSDSRNFAHGSYSHGLDDLANTEKMVSKAREDLAGLKHEVEEARAEVITCWIVLLCAGSCAYGVEYITESKKDTRLSTFGC